MRISRAFAGLILMAFLSGLAACRPVRLPSLGRAPAWKLKDLNGREISSDQFKGKEVLMDIWATWCVTCIEELPGYIRLQEKYGKDGLVIVGVSLDETGPDHVRQFVKTKGLNYEVVMGKLEEVEAIFGGLEALPTKLLIDRTGEIRDRTVGSAPANQYEKKLRAALM